MCLPKAPKEDPAVKEAQERARAAEQERIREEKEKTLGGRKRQLAGAGVRSLITGSGGGYGSNL